MFLTYGLFYFTLYLTGETLVIYLYLYQYCAMYLTYGLTYFNLQLSDETYMIYDYI